MTSPVTTVTDCDGSSMSALCHPGCIVCGRDNGDGLGLEFVANEDGKVSARFGCDGKFQGYPNRLHGGVITMLIDAAMTHCLFTRSVSAVTAKLTTRFRHPVAVGMEAEVSARVVRESSRYYVLESQIVQAGKVCAKGEGLFVPQSSD